MRGVQLSLGRSGRRPKTFQHTTQRPSVGEAQQPTTRLKEGFVSLGVASAAPRFDGPKGVEASALGRETRNTQDNTITTFVHLSSTQRAFMQRVQRCTVLRVRAGAGEWRGPWQSV